MESYGIEEARNQLGDLAERVRLSGEHISLTRYGKAAVVLVPAKWYQDKQREAERVSLAGSDQ